MSSWYYGGILTSTSISNYCDSWSSLFGDWYHIIPDYELPANVLIVENE